MRTADVHAGQGQNFPGAPLHKSCSRRETFVREKCVKYAQNRAVLRRLGWVTGRRSRSGSGQPRRLSSWDQPAPGQDRRRSAFRVDALEKPGDLPAPAPRRSMLQSIPASGAWVTGHQVGEMPAGDGPHLLSGRRHDASKRTSTFGNAFREVRGNFRLKLQLQMRTFRKLTCTGNWKTGVLSANAVYLQPAFSVRLFGFEHEFSVRGGVRAGFEPLALPEPR